MCTGDFIYHQFLLQSRDFSQSNQINYKLNQQILLSEFNRYFIYLEDLIMQMEPQPHPIEQYKSKTEIQNTKMQHPTDLVQRDGNETALVQAQINQNSLKLVELQNETIPPKQHPKPTSNISSSDSQCLEEKQHNQAKQQNETLHQADNNTDDVIDEKDEIRMPIVQSIQTQTGQDLFKQIMHQEYSQDVRIIKNDFCQLKSQNNLLTEENKGDSESKNQDKMTQVTSFISQTIQKPIKPAINQSNTHKQCFDEQNTSNKNVLIKNLIPSTKYLQPNSPQLFISPQSLLPNQVICVENNSTRVIMHMNKKIVPIPSSFEYDSNDRSTSPSPQKSKATLPSVQCPYLLGKLIVTNYKLIYMDSLYPNTMTFCMPLNYIYKLQRSTEQSSGVSYIQISLKTGLYVKFKYHQEQFTYSQKIKDIILTLMQRNLYSAIDYGQQEQNSRLRCKRYADKYFQEENVRKSIKGLEAEIIQNTDWKQMIDYPERYIVPHTYIGKRNVSTRIVVLSYLYNIQNQKIGLWRTGPGNPDPFEEQWLAKARSFNKNHVIEVKNKGIGTSKTQAARSIEIQNIYLLRQSYQKVHQLTYHNHDSNKWFQNMCGTRWYEQIAAIMNQAQYIIEIMSSKTHVTLLCDTEGRGAQIAAVVQLLMNPFYRTLQGFPHLIEKQFLHFACPKSAKKQREQDKSILLIQFFDCVYQFTHLYPLSFQFNEHYLAYLAQHVMSNKYGNFLYITRQFKKEKERIEVIAKCICIWEQIKRKIQTDKKAFFEADDAKKPIIKKTNQNSNLTPPIHELINYYIYFRNSFYIDHNENHSEVSKGIKLWASYFLKKVYGCELLKQQVLFCNQIEKRYLKISYEHNLIKKSNEQMRKKLSSQYSMIAEKKQVLKSTKQL